MTQDISDDEAMVSNMRNFNIAIAVISIVVFLLITSIYNSRNEKQKREIREAFQNYFSPQILQAILKEPSKLKVGGQRREVTVLFSDIRSFTTIAEHLPPAALSTFLQEYFNEMTEAVFATDGILDKYIGDAVMAFWGAPIEQPDQADRAVTTAIDMMNRLGRLQYNLLSASQHADFSPHPWIQAVSSASLGTHRPGFAVTSKSSCGALLAQDRKSLQQFLFH
jgi:GGDEF domain-containing protein